MMILAMYNVKLKEQFNKFHNDKIKTNNEKNKNMKIPGK